MLPLPALLVAIASPQWQAPSGCPDAEAVAQRLLALAGRVPDDAELYARAQVDGPPWRANIELERDGVRERRELAAQDCAGLVDAYAVVVAVAMDPLAVVRRAPRVFESPAPPRAPVPNATPAAEPASVAAPNPRVDAREPARPRRRVPQAFSLRAGSGVGFGGWRRASGGVELALGWTRGALGLELVGRYWIRRRDTLDRGGAITAELGTVGVRACWVGDRRRWSLSSCLGVEAGDFVIDGVAAPARARVHFPWVAPLAGARASVLLRAPLWLWLGLEAAVPVVQPHAVLRAAEPVPVYRAGDPALRVLAGLELRLRGLPRAR